MISARDVVPWSFEKRLPIDFVKLDQSFVSGVTTCPEDGALVMAYQLAHNSVTGHRGRRESEDHAHFLRLLGAMKDRDIFLEKPLRRDILGGRFLKQIGTAARDAEPNWQKQLDLPIPSSFVSSALAPN